MRIIHATVIGFVLAASALAEQPVKLALRKPAQTSGGTMNAAELGFFSIPVSDMNASKQFYKNVMGWEFKDRDANFSYIFANSDMIGSLETATAKFKPSSSGPLLYFTSDSIQKTLSKVTSNGGSVAEQVAIEDGNRGYKAQVLDPSKNSIGFWSTNK